MVRAIMPLPTIRVLNKSEDLRFLAKDVVLQNYKSHGRLKAPMKA